MNDHTHLLGMWSDNTAAKYWFAFGYCPSCGQELSAPSGPLSDEPRELQTESPDVSPVPPTAPDLISREAAIEALETWIANQPDGHYFGAWAVAIYEAQKILEMLPASAPPVAPALTHEDLQKAAAIAGADGCYFCALWFRQMFRRHTPPLPIHDFILAPAPSVGELE